MLKPCVMQFTNCMYDNTPSIALPNSNMEGWSGSEIDPIENLQNRRIYLETGTADPTVGVNPMNQLQHQLVTFGDEEKISYIKTEGAGHTFPTDFDAPGNAPCNVGSQSPFISNCGYDGAGEVLKWMYGDLEPRNDRDLAGSLLTFDQAEGLGAMGMAAQGYVYVPVSCQDGSVTCKLHVALHGCRQDPSHIGTTFIDNTGYQRWAGE